MAVISFAEKETEIFGVRKAVLRVILSRTRARLTDPADLEEIQLAEVVDGAMFEDMDASQRERLGRAVLGQSCS